MRAENIKISGIDSFQAKDMKISHSANEHAFVAVEGYISDADAEAAKRLALTDEIVKITAEGNGRNHTLCGYIYDMEIEHQLHNKYLKLTIVSTTIRMDKEKRTRTFQAPGTTIHQIISHVCERYGAFVTFHGQDAAINGMIAQYLETDWEFVKRLASQSNDVVIASIKLATPTLDIGLQASGETMDATDLNVSYRHELKHLRRETDYILEEKDVEEVAAKSRELYQVADAINTNKGTFYIYDVKSYFEKEELVIQYTGRRSANYKIPLQKNKNIIGASLEGKVSAVSGTNVQINLEVDSTNTLCGNRDFPYATVYSSEDGTGWYCMPEVGDSVRLYFPTDTEKNAYIISSVHLDVTMDNSESRTDPAIKSLSNAQKKEIRFAPDEIVITNNNGMAVVLNDSLGINIVTDKPILIHSDTSITLNAKDSILLNAGGEIRVEQSIEEEGAIASAINLKPNEVVVEGVEFRLEENAK